MDTTFDYSQHLPGDDDRRKAILSIKFMLFSASIIPAITAGAIAFSLNSFNWLPFILLMIALFLGQAGGDYLYYYFTHFHTDSRDAHTKIFAGWKPLFVGSVLKPRHSLPAGIMCLVIDALIGLYFYRLLGPAVFMLAAAGGLIAVFFTPLMLKGFKEPVVFITFGPLCVVSGVYVLTGEFLMSAFIASLPIGFLVTIVAYLKGAKFEVVREGESDVIMNLKRTIIYLLTILAYGSLVVTALLKHMPVWTLLGLVTIPVSLSVISVIKDDKSNVSDYLWGVVKAISALMICGMVISIGYIIS